MPQYHTVTLRTADVETLLEYASAHLPEDHANCPICMFNYGDLIKATKRARKEIVKAQTSAA